MQGKGHLMKPTLPVPLHKRSGSCKQASDPRGSQDLSPGQIMLRAAREWCLWEEGAAQGMVQG